MNSSKARNSLKSILESLEKERESLRHILLSGKISHETFDLLEGRIKRTISLASELEDALREEEAFWRKSLLNGVRILESILVELEHKRLLREIEEENYWHSREIIIDGISRIRDQMRRDEERVRNVTAVHQESTNNPSNREAENELRPSSRRSGNRMRKNRKSRETVGENDGHGISGVYCMNPWNPECRNTDIEVSIYYNGRMVPICRQCWEEIANRDVEWSSL